MKAVPQALSSCRARFFRPRGEARFRWALRAGVAAALAFGPGASGLKAAADSDPPPPHLLVDGVEFAARLPARVHITKLLRTE